MTQVLVHQRAEETIGGGTGQWNSGVEVGDGILRGMRWDDGIWEGCGRATRISTGMSLLFHIEGGE